MQYSEIDAWLYADEDNGTVADLTIEDRLPWQVIKFFNSLGGFDHWWDDIDEDTKDEVFGLLRIALHETIAAQKVAESAADWADAIKARDAGAGGSSEYLRAREQLLYAAVREYRKRGKEA